MADLRCPRCHYVYTIHNRDGTCPRWAVASLGHGSARVSIRIGTRRWPGSEAHVYAYFADSIDGDMVAAWDLTSDLFEPVPLITLRKETGWTRPGTRAEIEHALDELKMMLGGRVEHVKRIGF